MKPYNSLAPRTTATTGPPPIKIPKMVKKRTAEPEKVLADDFRKLEDRLKKMEREAASHNQCSTTYPQLPEPAAWPPEEGHVGHTDSFEDLSWPPRGNTDFTNESDVRLSLEDRRDVSLHGKLKRNNFQFGFQTSLAAARRLQSPYHRSWLQGTEGTASTFDLARPHHTTSNTADVRLHHQASTTDDARSFDVSSAPEVYEVSFDVIIRVMAHPLPWGWYRSHLHATSGHHHLHLMVSSQNGLRK